MCDGTAMSMLLVPWVPQKCGSGSSAVLFSDDIHTLFNCVCLVTYFNRVITFEIFLMISRLDLTPLSLCVCMCVVLWLIQVSFLKDM